MDNKQVQKLLGIATAEIERMAHGAALGILTNSCNSSDRMAGFLVTGSPEDIKNNCSSVVLAFGCLADGFASKMKADLEKAAQELESGQS